MFVTVVATVCRLLAAGIPVCEETIVTDSDRTEGLSFFECVARGQAPLADWKARSAFSSEEYRIEGYRCVAGHYEIKGRV